MNRYHRRRSVLFTGVLLLLLAGGAGLWLRVQQRQYALNRMLIAALVKGDDRQALALINAGADPNTRYHLTPMPSLSRSVNRLLHRLPPLVNQSPTALMLACEAQVDGEEKTSSVRPGELQLLQEMLKHGANINARNNVDATALVSAAYGGPPEVVRLLLHHGAKVNVRTKHGVTPLMYAVAANAPLDSVQLLLQSGADPRAQDMQGMTTLDYADYANDFNGDRQENRRRIVALLKQYGARK